MAKSYTLTTHPLPSDVEATVTYDADRTDVTKEDYDAQTILAATTDDTPAALTVPEQTLVGRITSGNIDALTATEVRTLLNVEDGADVTDATNVDTAGAVMEADFDANTILSADTDDTPAALSITEQTVVGRLTGESIKALSVAELQTLANVEDGADVTDATNVDAAGAVMEADFDANTILAADTDDTPAALTVAEDRIVGRKTGGNIAALTAAEVRAITAENKMFTYRVEDLGAGVDISLRPIFVNPNACTLASIGILTEGAPAGVDDSNTCVIELIDDGSNSIVSKTYNTGTQPPSSDYADLGSLDGTHKVLGAAEHVTLSVTNGATADLPAFTVVIMYNE